MRMARPRWWGISSLALVVWAAGCQNPDQLRIQALQEELGKVRDENDRLRSDIAKAISERDMWRNRAAALEQQFADLRGKGPGLPEGWEGTREFAWKDVGSDVLFDSGKTDLKSTGRATLQQVANEIKSTFPDRMILVIGHTDAEPIKKSHWKDNLELSANRGLTVFRELRTMGIEPANTIAAGQGEFNPRVPNDPKTGRSRENRRVQFFAVPKPVPSAAGATPGRAAERAGLDTEAPPK